MPFPEVPQIKTVPIVGQPQQPSKQQKTLDRLAELRRPLFRNIVPKTIQQGVLATFNYLFWKKDPYPLILCAGIWSDGKIVGVNLHYLTFKYIQYLLKLYANKAFTYQLIKNNQFVKNSFRSYKKEGIRAPRIFDTEFINALIGSVRSFSPTEIEAIRQEVQRQLRKRATESAEDMSNEFAQTFSTQHGDSKTRDDARRNPTGLGEL